MREQKLFAISIVLLAGVSAGNALSGEVKGPPGTVDNTDFTAAAEHANSNCAYSGLNDFDLLEGQNESIVQTAADAWKFYFLEHGFPGKDGACHGGTNEGRGGE